MFGFQSASFSPKGQNTKTFSTKHIIVFHHHRTKGSLHEAICIYLDSSELRPWQLHEREEHLSYTEWSRYSISASWITAVPSWSTGSISFKIVSNIVNPNILFFFYWFRELSCSLASLDEIFTEVNSRSLTDFTGEGFYFKSFVRL